MIRSCRLIVCLIAAALLIAAPSGPPTKVIKIPAGQTADVWLGVNVKGKVFYAIKTRDNKNSLRMWWIKFPLGTVKQLGNVKGNGSLPIPTLLNASMSAKLRASASSDTVVYIRDNAAVANNVTFTWP